ncbi:septum site-determining protein Ssd [Rhodococcus zopfii]|uniref:septum site-determining protein Ssd n=2 Tax=Rhodococcus zopfii TaxID=43772 RepID=UPI000933D912|nr:septum site-determining protein Ssd [Rhodococcus zopfii]
MNDERIPRILALISDSTLLASLRRVAAASDRDLDDAPVPPTRRSWDDAGLVVVDHATATALEAFPRRRGVVLVCSGAAGLPDWQAAASVGAEHVIALPDDEVELLAILGAAAEPDTGEGRVVTVVGGCGGAGASTFAAALAWTAADRDDPNVLLVDGDPYGAGLDVLTGLEDRPGVRWPGLAVEGGRVSARALRDAVPDWAPGLGLLSTDRAAPGEPPPVAVTAVLDAARRSGTVVVCDVSRSVGPAAETMIATADLAVVVTQARVGGALAAARTAEWVSARNPNVGLVVRGPAPGGLRGADVAAVVGIPLLAAMRAQPGLAEALEHGGLRVRRRSPLTAAADAVLAVVGLDRASPRWAA